MPQAQSYSQRLLREELRRRQARNARYSLRALARDLQIPRTTVSDVINGKRRLSKASIDRMKKQIALESTELTKLERESKSPWFETKGEYLRRTMEEDELQLLSSWYFYAILSLARVPKNSCEPRWVSRRLGLDIKTCRDAIERLVKMNLIKIENGQLVRTSELLQTSSQIPSRYIRDLHRQFLNLAEKSLDSVPIENREFNFVTLPIDTQRLAKAKEMITKFRRKLADFLNDDENPKESDAVYSLGIQLFPITLEEKRLD